MATTTEPRVATVSVTVGDQELTFESGKIAKQADGSVVVRSGDTMVLAAATGRMEAREGADFFPLTVDVEERMYAAGKIPGGFFKREGRASERATLTARMIDRPIRPLWPKGYKNEVHVVCTTLSADLITAHDILCINGASAALMVSPLPFMGPVGAVRIGQVDGEFVINPPLPVVESDESTLDLIVVGSKDALTMIEAGADEVPEATMLEAFELAHREIVKICEAQEDLRRQVGKEKWLDPELTTEIEEQHGKTIQDRIAADGLREAGGRDRGARHRAVSGALDGLRRRGHPAPDPGALEPRDDPRPDAARGRYRPGQRAVRGRPARAHRGRAGLQGAQVGQAEPALRADRGGAEAPLPGRSAGKRRRHACPEGLGHAPVRQEGCRGHLQGARPPQDRGRQAPPGRP